MPNWQIVGLAVLLGVALLFVILTLDFNRLRVLDSWTRNGLRLRVVRLRGAVWAEAWVGPSSGIWVAGWTPVPTYFGPGALGANRWADAMYDYDRSHALKPPHYIGVR